MEEFLAYHKKTIKCFHVISRVTYPSCLVVFVLRDKRVLKFYKGNYNTKREKAQVGYITSGVLLGKVQSQRLIVSAVTFVHYAHSFITHGIIINRRHCFSKMKR